MHSPEVGALLDTGRGQEALAILMPLHNPLGRLADGIQDRLLGFRLLEESFDIVARESVLARHLVDERAHFGP